MHLVLCHVADTSAVRAYQALQERAGGRVECVTVEELCAALVWEHRVDSSSSTLRVRLADGRVLDGDKVDSVLNRVHSVSPVGADRAAGDDGEYATQEFAAFFLSWLSSLGPRVVNEPSPQGLSGTERSAIEWTWLARQAGLPTLPRLETTPAVGWDPGPLRQDLVLVHVLGERVFGPALDADVRAACAELARRAGARLLGIALAPMPQGVAFVSATPTPPLAVEHEGFLDALCDLLGIGPAA